MQWSHDAFCEQGLRNYNEDGYLALEKSGLFAVADGLGGMPGGGEASQIILDLLKRECNQTEPSDMRALFRKINREATEYGYAHYQEGFGTTLTVIRLTESDAVVGHAGDSVAYRLRKGKLEPLTEEHTVATRLAKQQKVIPEEIPNHYFHSLTMCMGQDYELTPDVITEPLQEGDTFLLCSDGVSKILGESKLELLAHEHPAPTEYLQAIRDEVYAQGAPDNLTALLVYR